MFTASTLSTCVPSAVWSRSCLKTRSEKGKAIFQTGLTLLLGLDWQVVLVAASEVY